MKIFHIFLFLIWGVCVIKCENENQKWWQSTSIYEVYPRSFKDSDGDGVGDIKGIISKLDYLKEIGTEVIRITHLYKTSNRDFDRYEILNHKEIDSAIGTLEDFEELVKEAHKKGLKIIIDFVPNHTSDGHRWFLGSSENDTTYRDYYVWKRGLHYEYFPPNRWRNAFNGLAWSYRWQKGEFYYHSLSSNQPDLNLKNPLVVEELKEILKYWLKKGIDGVVLTEASYLIEKEVNLVEHMFMKSSSRNVQYDYESSKKLISEFKKEIETYSRENGGERILIAKIDDELVQDFNNEENEETSAHLAINQRLLGVFYSLLSIAHLQLTVTILDSNLKSKLRNPSTVWIGEMHNQRRTPNVHDDELVDIINGYTALLPGVMYTYYGQEIGLKSQYDFDKARYDKYMGSYDDDHDARYSERLPMQWDDTSYAGFTSGQQPWLDVHPEYWKENVKTEELEPKSHLYSYKQFLSLRKEPTFKYGDVETYSVRNKYIHAFSRLHPEYDTYIIVANFDCSVVTFNLEDILVFRQAEGKNKSFVPGKAASGLKFLETVVSSGNALLRPNDIVRRNDEDKFLLTMRPRSLSVFRKLNSLKTVRKQTIQDSKLEEHSILPKATVAAVIAFSLLLLILKLIA